MNSWGGGGITTVIGIVYVCHVSVSHTHSYIIVDNVHMYRLCIVYSSIVIDCM